MAISLILFLNSEKKMQIINTWNFCEPFLLFNYFVLFGHHEYRNGGTILYAAVCVPCYQTKCKAAILKVFAVLKKIYDDFVQHVCIFENFAPVCVYLRNYCGINFFIKLADWRFPLWTFFD